MKRWMIAVLAAIAATAACSQKLDTVPPEIRGVWMVGSGPHAGRAFELTDKQIFLSIGEGFEIHRIREVVVAAGSDGEREYSVHYRLTDGGLDALRIYHSAASPDEVRVHNTSNTPWHRADRDDTPWWTP
jgi:hypothetical protein